MTTPLPTALLRLLPAAPSPPLPWSTLWDALERAGVVTTAGELDGAVRSLGAEHTESRPGAMLYSRPAASPRTAVPTTTGGTLPARVPQEVVKASASPQATLCFSAPSPSAPSPGAR